jgi:hypothetical protein
MNNTKKQSSEHLTAIANVAIVLASIAASFDTGESEGRQI